MERPVANLGEFTHTLLAIRQEIDSTLDALLIAPRSRSSRRASDPRKHRGPHSSRHQ